MAKGQYGEQCISEHTVMIHDRGGVQKVHQLVDVTTLVYGRRLDGISEARFTLAGAACGAQAQKIDEIALAVRRYEAVIFRGGLRVWEGPIVQVETGKADAVFIAHDVKEYLDYTPLTEPWPIETGRVPGSPAGSPVPMTNRIEEIIEHELTVEYDMRVGTGGAAQIVTVPRWEQMDPPINVLGYIDIRHSATLYTRSNTEAFQMMLGEHLDSLSEGNLNYTVVGRRIVIWDSAEAIGRTRTVTDADFYGDIRVIAAGTEHASIGHVSATRPEDDDDAPLPPPPPGVVYGVGNAGGPNDYNGVWTHIASLDQEDGSDDPTQDELNSQAQRVIAGRTPVPTEIRVPDGAGIRLSHDLGIQHLVPGTIMPVLAVLNIRKVSQDQMISSVTVTETPEGETIQVSLISAGDVTAVA